MSRELDSLCENTKTILRLSDGRRSAAEIAAQVGLSPRYVRKVMTHHDAPRLKVGAQPAERNHQFVSGRIIQHDGYALIPAPADHPYARRRSGRDGVRLIAEHRWLMEKTLQRYLLPSEVVDHTDGLRLHNSSENLRVFPSNAEHLRSTLSGTIRSHCADPELVDRYHRSRATGDFRLRQILLVAWTLGRDSPYLLGTRPWLQRAGISSLARPTLKRELNRLAEKWGWPLVQ